MNTNQEMNLIGEMREMIALGWEKQEAYDKYEEFVERLNGDGDLTGDMSKDEILTVWENANAAQAEEIADTTRYWLETDANFDQYQADEEARKWALHKVVGDKDEVILSLAYSETPGFEGDKEQEPLDTSWKALDDYIKSELGFLPEYEVN